MEDPAIEKDIEIPPPTRSKYRFEEMEKGDSQLIPYNDDHPSIVANRVINAARAYVLKAGGKKKFTTRQLGNGLRVWRVE